MTSGSQIYTTELHIQNIKYETILGNQTAVEHIFTSESKKM